MGSSISWPCNAFSLSFLPLCRSLESDWSARGAAFADSPATCTFCRLLCTPLPLTQKKIRDRKRKKAELIAALAARLARLRIQPPRQSDFVKEMRRYLPAAVVCDALSKKPTRSFLVQAVSELGEQAVAALKTRS